MDDPSSDEHSSVSTSERASELALAAHGVSVRFGGQLALRDVDLEVERGTIHAIAGENGAGKSTLIKVLAGIHRPDEGELLIGGRAVAIRDPRHAGELGFGFLHQQLHLVHDLTVRENLHLTTPYPLLRLVRIGWRTVDQQAEHFLRFVGLDISPRALVGDLSPAQQQLVAFARVLLQKPNIIVLDEPTAALGEADSQHMLAIVRQQQASGATVIFISHRLDEILAIASRVTVLRDGKLVGTVERSRVTRSGLVEMLGGAGELQQQVGVDRPKAVTPRLDLREVEGPGLEYPVSMSVDPGEVVGFAGLAGSGRTRLAEIISGAQPCSSGSLWIDGAPVRLRDRHHAATHGIVMLPADRSRSVVPDFSIPANITLGNCHAYSRWHFLLDKRREGASALAYINELKIRAGKSDARLRYLSGGNQQKVLLARALDLKPRTLILDEATAGIDIATKEYIYRLVRELANSGMSIVFISSELDELPLVSDRILVFTSGRITARLPGNVSRGEIVSHLFADASAAGDPRVVTSR